MPQIHFYYKSLMKGRDTETFCDAFNFTTFLRVCDQHPASN